MAHSRSDLHRKAAQAAAIKRAKACRHMHAPLVAATAVTVRDDQIARANLHTLANDRRVDKTMPGLVRMDRPDMCRPDWQPQLTHLIYISYTPVHDHTRQSLMQGVASREVPPLRAR